MINSCSLSGSHFLLSGHMWKLRLSYSLSFWAKPAPNHNQFTKYRTNRSKKMRSSSIEISTIGDDESGILPSISFCTNMQTEVSLVNLSLTRFNNVLLRSPLKLLVTHLTRWKLSHYFHQLFKKKKGKRKPTLKVAGTVICPLSIWLHCLWIIRDCLEPLCPFCAVWHMCPYVLCFLAPRRHEMSSWIP